jgi:hypothetical protein
LGDQLITAGGDLFTSNATRAEDMRYVSAQSVGGIGHLAWDGPNRAVFTLEGSTLRYYNLTTHLEIGSQALNPYPSFVGVSGGIVYVATYTGSLTQITAFANPAKGGATNTAPAAHFTVSPATNRTTMTDLVLDASSSSDAEDPSWALQFRWDLDGDGRWDTRSWRRRRSPTVSIPPERNRSGFRFETIWRSSRMRSRHST